jgi:hypothetical protein
MQRELLHNASRPAHAALAASVLVLSACGSASTSPSRPVAQTPSAPGSSAPTVNSPTASATPAAPDISWSEQTFEDAATAVVADRGTFVAVSNRSAWTSSDGRTWTRQDVPDPAPNDCEEPDDPVCFPNTAGMGQLARLGDTLYSIGVTESFNDYLRPVGWRLTDGEAWQAIASQSSFYDFGWLIDLSAGDTSLLATKFGPAPFMSNAWLWTFEDSWTATDLAGSNETPIDVFDTTWGDETFLAIGERAEPIADVGSDQWPVTASVWRSSDGLTWASVEAPPGATSLCAVSATSQGFMTLGMTDTGPAVWTSTDASSWSNAQLAPSAESNPDRQVLFPDCGIVELSNGFLAVMGVEEGTLTWTSANGTAWEASETLDLRTGPDRIAALGQMVVLFGNRGDAYDPSDDPVLLLGTVEP